MRGLGLMRLMVIETLLECDWPATIARALPASQQGPLMAPAVRHIVPPMTVGEPFTGPGLRGFLHRPDVPGGDGLVLAHGAGGNCNAPVLVAAAEAFCGAGLMVLRIDLPFRQRRPRGPPSPHAAAEDRAGLRRAATTLREI